jgi:cell division protein YceG involved in septum cleavage
LHAVLHPAESVDLYFVADDTGGHVLVATLA